MNIFNQLLAPFVFIVEQVFLLSYRLTGNYGVSILLLSFAISMLLLPVFILIERSKRRDDVIKLKMKPLLAEINRCYKGQERYYYIRTLHRQHGYSSFKSLVPVLSLLLQIPFFIAAYQFLEHFEPLAGQSFLFIDDLSAPDKLLGPINLLPIIMTVVNLVTAYFYTRNGDKAERRQMLVVAGVFLVLLYNFPSGLVLYWTMNNVFSFFRLFVTNPEVFRRSEKKKGPEVFSVASLKAGLTPLLPKLLRVFATLAIVVILSQLHWSFMHNFNDIALRIAVAVIGSLVLTGLIAVVLLVYHEKLKAGIKKFKELMPWRTFRITQLKHFGRYYAGIFWVLSYILVVFQLNWALEFNFNDIVVRLSVSIAGSWIIVLLVANIIAFLKRSHLITREGFYKQVRLILPGFKVFFIILSILAIAFQINWALQNSFHDIGLRLIIAPAASLFITVLIALGYIASVSFRPLVSEIPIKPKLHLSWLFLAIYFYLAAKYYFSGESGVLTLLAVVLTLPVQIISVIYFRKSATISSKWLFSLTAMIILLLHAIQIINLAVMLTPEGLSINLLNTHFRIQSPTWDTIVAIGILVSLIAVPFYLKNSAIKAPSPPKYPWLLLALSILYIGGLIFFWNPMIVYSSYPKNFDFPAINFLTNNYRAFLLIIGSVFLIYLLTPKYLKHIYIQLIVFVAFIVFLYSSVIPFDAGTLQMNQLTNEQNLAKAPYYYVLEALLLIGILYGTRWLLKIKHIKYTIIALVVINLMLVGQSLYLAIKTGSFFSKEVVVSSNPYDSEGKIPFSKDGENVLLFLVDGAQGWYMHDLVKEDSSLRDVFSGFTYYPNTLSMGSFTHATLPAMMNGYDYSIANMNKDKNKTISQKVTEATELFYKKIKDRGFDFTSTIIRYSKIDRNKFDHYIPSWHDSWSEILELGDPEEIWYTRLWENALFSGAPLFLKPGIYNDTKWLMKEKTNLNLSELQKYHFVRLLPKISNTNNQKPNFIFIHCLFAHNPWNLINEKNQFIRDVTPYECQRSFTYTFAEWLKWMKENGVYDNTKIILVSDHGPSWWQYKGKKTTNAPIVWTEEKKVSLGLFLILNPLLMVKDFNSEFPMKDDWRLMNNADVSAIAFDENDPTKTDSTSRTLPTFYTEWHSDYKTRTDYEIRYAFKVKDYAYDLHNWTSIKDETDPD